MVFKKFKLYSPNISVATLYYFLHTIIHQGCAPAFSPTQRIFRSQYNYTYFFVSPSEP